MTSQKLQPPQPWPRQSINSIWNTEKVNPFLPSNDGDLTIRVHSPSLDHLSNYGRSQHYLKKNDSFPLTHFLYTAHNLLFFYLCWVGEGSTSATREAFFSFVKKREWFHARDIKMMKIQISSKESSLYKLNTPTPHLTYHMQNKFSFSNKLFLQKHKKNVHGIICRNEN
jgi:hypothetical protein